MNNFIANYEKILGILQQVEQKKIFLNQIRIPKLSDIKLLSAKSRKIHHRLKPT